MKLLYIFPLSTIKEMFPDFNPNTDLSSQVSVLACGWCTEMKNFCGYAFLYREYKHHDSRDYFKKVYQVENCRYYFDERIVKIIEIDPNLKKECYFVEPVMIEIRNSPFEAIEEITAYKITSAPSENTIGGIANIKKRIPKRSVSKLRGILQDE